jgi:hypothetical protein
MWSPACSVFWALWGIIQAEEHVGKMVEDVAWLPEFDYLVSLAFFGADSSRMPWSGWKCSERKRWSWECPFRNRSRARIAGSNSSVLNSKHVRMRAGQTMRLPLLLANSEHF